MIFILILPMYIKLNSNPIIKILKISYLQNHNPKNCKYYIIRIKRKVFNLIINLFLTIIILLITFHQ